MRNRVAESLGLSSGFPSGLSRRDRVGDFVFTYHGAVLDGRAPGLWLVVMTPDPDTRQFGGSGTPVVVGQADGTVLLIPAAQFTARLKQQNHLRAAQGLPPLPYPPTLTHQEPAVADPP